MGMLCDVDGNNNTTYPATYVTVDQAPTVARRSYVVNQSPTIVKRVSGTVYPQTQVYA